jgi:hypothetical protein
MSTPRDGRESYIFPRTYGESRSSEELKRRLKQGGQQAHSSLYASKKLRWIRKIHSNETKSVTSGSLCMDLVCYVIRKQISRLAPTFHNFSFFSSFIPLSSSLHFFALLFALLLYLLLFIIFHAPTSYFLLFLYFNSTF